MLYSGSTPWVRTKYEWFAEIVPCQIHAFLARLDRFSPERIRIPRLGEDGMNYGKSLVLAQLACLLLQPSCESDVVGIDPRSIICKLALQEEGVSDTGRGKQYPPVTGLGRRGPFFFIAQADERVLSRKADLVWVGYTRQANLFRA